MKLKIGIPGILVSIASCLFVLFPNIAFADPVVSPPLSNGVVFKSDTIGRAVARVLEVDTTRALISIEGKGGAETCNSLYSTSEVVAMDSGDLIGAVNANFFSGETTLGDYIGNRVYYGPEYGGSNPSYVAIDHAGRIQTGSGKLTPAMVSGFSTFLRGAYRIGSTKPFTEMTDADVTARFLNGIYNSHPTNATDAIARTMLGINQTENKMYVVTFGAGGSSGTGILPAAAVTYLKSLGATEGYVLDSGGSTFIHANQRMYSNNSTTLTDGRRVTSILTVRARGPRTEAETNALPVKNCSGRDLPSDTPTTSNLVEPGAPAQQPAAPANIPPAGSQPVVSNVNVAAGAVPLEVAIGGITSINAEGGLIVNYTKILFGYAAGLVGLIAMIMLIVSGFQIMIVGGEGIKAAQERIVGTITGLVLLATSGFVLNLVNPCFFNFSNANACTARITTGSTQNPVVAGGSNVPSQPISSGGQAQVAPPSGNPAGPFADVAMIARVNSLAAAHRALPALTVASSGLSAGTIKYPGGRTYNLTPADKEWMGRMVQYEGGASNANFGAEIIWIVVQRFAWEGYLGRHQAFDVFMRDFSEPINAEKTEHPEALTRRFDTLSATTQATVNSFFAGTLLNPVPGIVDFASNSRGVGLRCAESIRRGAESSVIFVRNKSAPNESFSAPADHSRDDCNAQSDHLWVGRHSIGLSTDQGYETIQVVRP